MSTATAATPAFKKATMTTQERAALKKELFAKEIEDHHASFSKMAFKTQKLEINTRLEQNSAAYADFKAIYDNLMKAAKPLKIKMTKANRVVKTLTAYKKTWNNERKQRPKTFHKVSGRSVFMGHYIKSIKEKAEAAKVEDKTKAFKLDPKTFMTEASAAWAALTDDEKADWKAKAVDKNIEKETARAKATLLGQVDALVLLASASDSDSSLEAPMDSKNDSDSDSDADADAMTLVFKSIDNALANDTDSGSDSDAEE